MPELSPGEGEIPDMADTTKSQNEDRPAYWLMKFTPQVKLVANKVQQRTSW